jgi:hypothetical protein
MDELQKYSPTYSLAFRAFSLVHLTVIFSLLCFLFFRFGEITQAEALINGGLLFAAIFGFTSFLDKKLYGFISMLVVTAGLTVYPIITQDWFGLNQFLPSGHIYISLYFFGAFTTSMLFWRKELSKDLQIY